MLMRPPVLLVRALSLVLIASLCACAGSSKSSGKRKRTVLMSSYHDAPVRKAMTTEVHQERGVIDDPALTSYVSGIGQKLLRGLPHRTFRYEFKVLDQAEPNAFAAPGGFIFISRGLLLLANNEDELACVLGHEITHVAQRHAATQRALDQKDNATKLGWGKAQKSAAYSREMERAADEGGQRLCAAAGYNPMGMSSFLRSLEQLGRLTTGYSRVASFLDTHPGSRERAAANAARAGEFRARRDRSIGDTRLALLRHTEGLEVGARPKSGLLDSNLFLSHAVDLQVRFPFEWRMTHAADSVGAVAPRDAATIRLTSALPYGEPEARANQWLQKERGLRELGVEESKPVMVGDLAAWQLVLTYTGPRGPMISYATFIPYRGSTWGFVAEMRASQVGALSPSVLETVHSFGPMNEVQRRRAPVARLRVARAQPGESFTAVSGRTGNSWDLAYLAVYNGLFRDHRFDGGEFVKVARVGRY